MVVTNLNMSLTVSVILLAFLSAESVCAANSGDKVASVQPERIPKGANLRLLEREDLVKCRLWQNCISYPDHEDDHQWQCSFNDPGLSSKHGGYDNKVIVGPEDTELNAFLEINHAKSGSTVLIVSKVEMFDERMVVDTSDVIAIEDYDSKHIEDINDGTFALRGKPMIETKNRRRRMETTTVGTLITLVVRVNTRDSGPPPAADLSTDIFDDEYCLKSQYGRCSHGQLNITEYVEGTVSEVPTVAPGVIDILLRDTDAATSTKELVQDLANVELQAMLGVTDPSTVFDLVMFCMPPGMGNWMAYAYLGRWDSYFNNDYCQSVTQQMHEVGHSLGLHHSGEYHGSDDNQEYGDQTDLMGYSYRDDDTPAQCFNPAKSYQLGWYTDKTIDLDPSTDLSLEVKSFILNGVVDYADMTVDSYVVAKIYDYYIGFNRATSFNEGVMEAVDMVTIVEKLGSADSQAKSKLVGKLSLLERQTIKLTDQLSVEIFYASNNGDGKDAVIEIKVVGEYVECDLLSLSEVTVELVTDYYPEETSWGITDSNGQFIEYHGVISDAATLITTLVEDICRGVEYKFVIQDAYNDGICCGGGSGSYTVLHGDTVLFTGGQFTDGDVVPFTIPALPTDQPTTAATTTPTATPTVGPTGVPSSDPTTAATTTPTATPTVGPTGVPSSDPTTAATTTPTTTPVVFDTDLTSCVDRADFLYRNKDEKDCDWVNQGNDRITKIKCLRRANTNQTDERKVYEYCQKTCEKAGIKKACMESTTE